MYEKRGARGSHTQPLHAHTHTHTLDSTQLIQPPLLTTITHTHTHTHTHRERERERERKHTDMFTQPGHKHTLLYKSNLYY